MIYSNCYHAHTPFIDMTSITVLGRLMSAQTANCALPPNDILKAGQKPSAGGRRGDFAL